MDIELSILIPSRNEMFLAKTIEDILSHSEANTEVIAVLDGTWADPPIPQNDRVNVIYLKESVGQRAATNLACKLSRAKYVMKVDAHCSFDQGFDRKMLEAFQSTGDNVTMVPIMRNLWAFDWKCFHCGWKRYQGPTPKECEQCKKSDKLRRKILWIGKHNPQSTSYCFDPTPHFQYFEDWKHREPYITDKKEKRITETMSLQGSAWMLTREKYWDLNICDEAFGSWGSQGIEVAVKTWLSGGRVLVNHNTWYAHMFRTQGGDFSFPYKMTNRQQRDAQNHAKELFFRNNWEKQIYPLSWLIEKFWPVKGWTDDDLQKLKGNTFEFKDEENDKKTEELEPKAEAPSPTAKPSGKLSVITFNLPSKGIVYISDSQLDDRIALMMREQISQISQQKNIPIVSSTLKKTHFGIKNIHYPSLPRGYYALIKQIIGGLEHSESEIIFICEHDVLYHPSHFDFIPKRKLAYYYNTNVWRVRLADEFALKVNDLKQLSGLCGYRKTLLTHFNRKFALMEEKIEKLGNNGKSFLDFEKHKYLISDPGLMRSAKDVDNYAVRTYQSEFPNIDLRHGENFTKTKWNKDEYNNKKDTNGWSESTVENIPGWKNLASQLQELRDDNQKIIYFTDQSSLVYP